ncbi:hypothetical protein ACF0H5_004874 [Mactra antiquata]
MATITGDFAFTEEEATQMAEKLKNAMDGFGTNEDEIIQVLVTHSSEQRQVLADKYLAAYGESLVEDLKSELSGDLEECVVGLMMRPRYYDAKVLHDAISGAGTDEKTLIGVMCSRNNEEIEDIKKAYAALYDGADLTEDLSGDTSGYFKRLMVSLSTGCRNEEEEDDDKITEDAQKLIDAGVNQVGTDECDFNSVLCLKSEKQLKKVLEKYQELRETDLEDDIASEMSSDLKDGYLAVVKMVKNKYKYFAERLNNAMRGFGTDDSELIRLIISRSEEDLLWVAEEYEKLYEVSLFDDVKSECSGYYKSLLLSLIVGRFVSKDE